MCTKVEHYNHYAKRGDRGYGVRQDLFGIIDVLALDIRGRRVLGVQVCGSDFQPHVRKMLAEKREISHWWLTCGAHLELHGWRKVKKKRGGKQMIWKPRIRRFTLEDDFNGKEFAGDLLI